MMSGASVFLVEDEALIRMMIVDMLDDLGQHRVVAEAGSIEVVTFGTKRGLSDLEFDIKIGGTEHQSYRGNRRRSRFTVHIRQRLRLGRKASLVSSQGGASKAIPDFAIRQDDRCGTRSTVASLPLRRARLDEIRERTQLPMTKAAMRRSTSSDHVWDADDPRVLCCRAVREFASAHRPNAHRGVGCRGTSASLCSAAVSLVMHPSLPKVFFAAAVALAAWLCNFRGD